VTASTARATRCCRSAAQSRPPVRSDRHGWRSRTPEGEPRWSASQSAWRTRPAGSGRTSRDARRRPGAG
jgi:hypothetical protein